MVMTEAHYKIVTSRAFRLLHVAETFRVLPEMQQKLRVFVSTNLSSKGFEISFFLFDFLIEVYIIIFGQDYNSEGNYLYVKDGTFHRSVYKFRGHAYPEHQ